MKDEFNEYDEFDDLDDIDDDFFNQDNYEYDDETSFDGTTEDYDYLDYTYNTVDRKQEDTYDEEVYEDEEYEENKSNMRSKIIKFLLVLMILLLIIWIVSLVSKNVNNKKVDDSKDEVTVIQTNTIDFEEMFLKTKSAATKYFNEERVKDDKGQEKSLKLLKSLEYISDIPDGYNLNQSNVKLTDGADKYNLTITLVYNDDKQIRNYEVNNYSYCTDSYLCEEQNILSDEEEITDTENDNDEVTDNNTNDNTKKVKLSSWSLWSNYEKTSCNTKAISCASNDTNCLTELKTYERKEKVSTHKKVYSNSRLAFTNNTTENKAVCNKFDYIKINGVYYRTEKNSNFKMLGGIKKDTMSNYYNFRYDGRNSYSTPPSDTINTRYVFVGPDYTNCTSTCNNNIKYYYDKYTFTKTLTAVNNPSKDCNNVSTRIIPNYSIAKQNISVTRDEDLYGTVCYKSIRTRKLIEE
ncbi:MAG: hypothetical protein J6A17_01025 [Bacilli bacterium]|nr:hypothetical protein [Bacilli bacterium]